MDTITFNGKMLLCCLGFLLFSTSMAIAEDGTTRTADASMVDKPSTSLIDVLQQNHLSLGNSLDSYQNSVSVDDNTHTSKSDRSNDNPATFTFAKSPNKDAVYSTDFYLQWRPNSLRELPFSDYRNPSWGSVSLEGHLSDSSTTDENVWHFRATDHILFSGIDADKDGVISRRLGPIDNLNLDSSLKYDANRSFNFQQIVGEFRLFPTCRMLGIGKEIPIFSSNTELVWLPFVAVDAGTTLRRPRGSTGQWLVARPYAGLEAKFFLHWLERALFQMNEVSVTFGDTFYYEPTHRGETHNFLNAGLHFVINDNASFDVTYKIGRSSPQYLKTEVLGAGVGFRF